MRQEPDGDRPSAAQLRRCEGYGGYSGVQRPARGCKERQSGTGTATAKT